MRPGAAERLAHDLRSVEHQGEYCPAGPGDILEPFAQLEGTFARMHEETGLGLTLVKNIDENRGATVGIESELGAGATVSVRFPPECTIGAAQRASAGPG